MSTGCTAPIEFELLNSQARRIVSYNTTITIGSSPWAKKLCLPENFVYLKEKPILAAYVLTGCDQIGKFNTVSKDRAFKVFMRLASDVINGLGADFTFEMTSDCGKAVSKFIMLLYASMLK